MFVESLDRCEADEKEWNRSEKEDPRLYKRA